MERKLLTIKELCAYLGIWETKARELVRGRTALEYALETGGMQIKINLINVLIKWLFRLKTRGWSAILIKTTITAPFDLSEKGSVKWVNH